MKNQKKAVAETAFFVGAGKGLVTFFQGCESAADGAERYSQKRIDDCVRHADCRIFRECRVFGFINLTDGLA